MMNGKTRHLILSIALFFLFPVLAFADTVQGTVLKANRTALEMAVYDNHGRPYPNALQLKVDRATRLGGFSSMNALRNQDPVRVEVRQESVKVWRADSITKLQNTSAIQSSAAPTSPSLVDALKSPTGQKIIRNGLTGALTGAVASGASGGKAGKGALIGAGVGIAGGFLADMFSQHSQSQSSSATVSSSEDSRR